MRPDDWAELLDGYVEQARGLAFAWGRHDCVTFTCGWVRLVTGRDPFAPFREKYASEQSAFRLMHGHGVRMMEDAGDYLFGFERKAVEFVNRGDIVLAENALGICVGARGAFLTVEGLGFVGSQKFQIAWSV